MVTAHFKPNPSPRAARRHEHVNATEEPITDSDEASSVMLEPLFFERR
jgi:hypothetical protein